MLAVDRASREMVNLGTAVPTSVNDIVRAVNRILGTSLEPVYEPERPGEIQRITLDGGARARCWDGCRAPSSRTDCGARSRGIAARGGCRGVGRGRELGFERRCGSRVATPTG